MRDKGYNYDYWVRSDGVKMYGNYVMVAADLSTRPKGTIVETTLGDGIVVDTGTFVETPDLQNFDVKSSILSEILETGLPVSDSKFVNLVLSHYSVNQLYGMSIKDKRGGENNIHSWDIEIKGKVSTAQKDLMNLLLCFFVLLFSIIVL